MANPEIKIVLKAVDGGFEGTINKAIAGTDRLADSVKTVGHYGAALVGVNVFGGWARQAITVADAFSTLDSRLKVATGSTAEATAAYAQLFDVAQRSRVSFTDLGATYSQLARSTKELGTSSADLKKVTEVIAKSMTISGGSAESMKAALMQLSQGFASGTLRGEELNSVMEQTPRLAQAIANGLGVSIGDLRRMGEEGKLTAEAVMGALKSQASAIDEEFGKMKVTVGQSFQVLTDAAGNFLHKIDESSGASVSLSKGILGMADAINTASDAAANAKPLIDMLTMLLALGGIAGAGKLIGRAGMAIGGSAVALPALGVSGLYAATQSQGFADGMALINGGQPSFNQNKSLSEYLASQGIITQDGDGANTSALRGGPAYSRPADLNTKGQKYDADRGKLIATAIESAKKQGLAESDAAYKQLFSDLGSKLREMDVDFNKKGAGGGSRKNRFDANEFHNDNLISDAKKAEAELKERKRLSDEAARANSSMAQTVDNLSDAYARQNAVFTERGMSVEERELAAALRQVEEQADRAREALSAKAATLSGDNVIALEAFRNAVVSVSEAEAKQAEQARANHAERLRQNEDWKTGFNDALTKYEASSRNVAQTADAAFTGAFRSMENAIVEFTTTGKLSYKDMARSIIADLSRIYAKQAVTGLVKMGVSAVSSFFGPTMSGSGTATENWIDSGGLAGARAAGGPVAAGKTYLVGEKGPELLTMGTSGGNITPNNALGGTVNITVNNQAAGDGYEASATAKKNGAGFDIDVMVIKVIQNDMRRNGPITQGFANTFGMSRSAA